MGNEQSQIPGMEIDRKVVEVTDFWVQQNAIIGSVENISKLSIFVGDLFINEPFWNPHTPLERFSKNLMLYRHPCIIKYISSWQKGSKYYLAVEEVTPLSHLISTMSSIDMCLGLYSILKALSFLHEKAMVSHNNVCLASIFVSNEGSWKLGGMEYLCQYKDLSPNFLTLSSKHRYSKAIDTKEEKHLKIAKEKDFIDLYAFCVLVNDILKTKTDTDISNVTMFKEFCKNVLQTPDILKRPKLNDLLQQEFFKHKFLNIHSYLIELPLKLDSDKSDFFTSLKDDLEILNEEDVASKLGGLLVSRMVMLNKVAQNCLLPHILIPRKERNGLFCEDIFRKFIVPKLLKIFCVRDAQIRLILLQYFPHYFTCFSKEELQLHILPELLVGIKDTNNDLVSATLHTLADLVIVLGAEIVIGGKRGKLFNDGRPKVYGSPKKVSQNSKPEIQGSKITLPNIDHLSLSSSLVDLIHSHSELPERPRPDGEEGETSTEEIEQSADEDLDNWEDWGNEHNEELNTVENTAPVNTETEVPPNDTLLQMVSRKGSKDLIIKPNRVLDITELDIKNQAKVAMKENEVDFFQDMEPIIDKNNKFLIGDDATRQENDSFVSSKLSVNVDDSKEDGWENDDWE